MNQQTILITGSSRGIGKAIALTFAKKQYNIVINGFHNPAALKQTEKDIKALGTSCLSLCYDVGNYKDVSTMFQQIHNHFGKINILVNNSGISHIGLLQDMTPAQWNNILSTNLTSVFNCCSHSIPDMLSLGNGKIINISSVWGITGASCEAAYSASKGGINTLTKALAKELAPSNIQVNAVACGAIDTEMNHFLTEEELATLKEEIPAGRLGRPEEVAQLVYSLTKSSTYLTGQIIKLDGGWI